MFLYFVAILVSVGVTWLLNRPGSTKPLDSLHESDLKIIEPEDIQNSGDIYGLLRKIIAGQDVGPRMGAGPDTGPAGPVHVTYSVNGFTYKICLDLDDHVLEHQVHAVSRKIIHAYLIKNNSSDTKDITESLIMYQGPNHDFYYSVPQASKKLSDILCGILGPVGVSCPDKGPVAVSCPDKGPHTLVWDTLCIYDLHGSETFIDLKTDKYIYLV